MSRPSITLTPVLIFLVHFSFIFYELNPANGPKPWQGVRLKAGTTAKERKTKYTTIKEIQPQPRVCNPNQIHQEELPRGTQASPRRSPGVQLSLWVQFASGAGYMNVDYSHHHCGFFYERSRGSGLNPRLRQRKDKTKYTTKEIQPQPKVCNPNVASNQIKHTWRNCHEIPQPSFPTHTPQQYTSDLSFSQSFLQWSALPSSRKPPAN